MFVFFFYFYLKLVPVWSIWAFSSKAEEGCGLSRSKNFKLFERFSLLHAGVPGDRNIGEDGAVSGAADQRQEDAGNRGQQRCLPPAASM